MEWKYEEDAPVSELKEELVKVRGQVNTLIQDFRSKLPKNVNLIIECTSEPMTISQKYPNYFIDLELRV